MSGHEHTAELDALETQLRRLAPRESDIDRDQLMYRAGRDSVRGLWVWPVATAVSTLTAMVLGVLLSMQPGERVVYVPIVEQAPSPPVIVSPPSERIEASGPVAVEELSPKQRLLEHLVRWGLDGLSPAPPPLGSPPRSLSSHYSDLTKGEFYP